MIVRTLSLPQRLPLPISLFLPFAGALAITLATQVRVDLPFTPVPITGQTFVVILWGLLFGTRQGALAAAAYLAAGAFGAPVFAGFTSITALWGPTAGYLLGFVPAAALAGWLSERGFTRNLWTAAGASLLASAPIFVLGTPVLAVFVGWDHVVEMGVLPFVVGDIVKSALAAIVVRSLAR